MTTSDDWPAKQRIARQVFDVLERAVWGEEDDLELKIARLTDAVQHILTISNKSLELVVSDERALGRALGFAAAINKTIDRSHPARPPSRQQMTDEQYVADVAAQLPTFKAWLQGARTNLIREYKLHSDV